MMAPIDARERAQSPTNRREFLGASLATVGCLLLGVRMPAAGAAGEANIRFVPDAFIRIDHSGKVTLIMPQTEMGQGIYTAVAAILAEELDAAFDQIALEAAPPNDKLYANPLLGFQATGGSTSVRAFWMPLRRTAAIARQLLVQAAAKQLKVDPSTLSTSNGMVMHSSSGRQVSYGSLVQVAQSLTPPKEAPLKDPKNFVLIGKPLKRFDTPDKVNGKVVYGIDAMPPGLKFAMLAASPVFGGKVKHVDDSKTLSMPGVRQVVVLGDLVAVVADHTWAAKQGLSALKITWDEGNNGQVSSDDIWRKIRASSLKDGAVAKNEGDVVAALKKGELHQAVYELPFLAHASMEPMNCTVHISASGCEIWVGSQVVSRAQGIAMKLTGLPADKVVVHNHLIGGGFGRRLDIDGIEKSVRIAQKVEGPVKVTWSREEDMQQDFYRPVYLDRLSASVLDGRIQGWKHRTTGSSILARWAPPAFQKGVDGDGIDGAVDNPYGLADFHVEYLQDEPFAVPTGFWRGVGPNNNVFAVESFMDELAKKSNIDPVKFRLAHLDKSPRFKAALEMAVQKSNWGSALPAGTGRGVCVSPGFGSCAAAVVEARVDQDGKVHVQRVVMAVDTGIVVNPDTIVAQLQGGIIFGLTAALYGRIDIEKGRVKQSNFHDYRMMRINEIPKIEIFIIPSGEAPGGIGEAGTTIAPPALANAIFAATGVRLRSLPIDQSLLAGKRSA
jgi:isoquinoline 1-oxidoreductase beta subunit